MIDPNYLFRSTGLFFFFKKSNIVTPTVVTCKKNVSIESGQIDVSESDYQFRLMFRMFSTRSNKCLVR